MVSVLPEYSDTALLVVIGAAAAAGIRPLSGTNSFSNDTVRFTNFFVYNGDRICLNKSIILGGIKI